MFKLNNYELFQGDSIDVLRTLPDGFVNCCVTSPPYYGLRDYGTGKWIGGDPDCPHYRTSKVSDSTATGHSRMAEAGEPVGDAIYKSVCPLCGAVREDKQIGLEETPEEYIQRLVDVFREVKRVLKDDGTLWVNIGDTYNSSASGNHDNWSEKQSSNNGSLSQTYSKHLVANCKQKDLIGIPWMLAFALRQDGWYLRQDIVWAKPNPMPESVKDRCTRSHEYIFLLSKSPKYFYDYEAIQEVATGYDGRKDTMLKGSKKYLEDGYFPSGTHTNSLASDGHERWKWKKGESTISKEDFMMGCSGVWHMGTTQGYTMACFPEKLPQLCIDLLSYKGDVVLDPFSGSGTTCYVAKSLGRKFLGFEISKNYWTESISRLHGNPYKVTENTNPYNRKSDNSKIDLW